MSTTLTPLPAEHHLPEETAMNPRFTRPREWVRSTVLVIAQNGSVGQVDEVGITLLDGVAAVTLVVDGNGDEREAARAGITGCKCRHTRSASRENLDIGEAVHKQGVESITHSSVLDTLPTAEDENAERHAQEHGHDWSCGAMSVDGGEAIRDIIFPPSRL